MRSASLAPSRTNETPVSGADLTPAQERVLEELAHNEATVSRAIRVYLWSLLGQNAAAVASEFDDLWATVRATALHKAALYDPQKSANAWLCAIAFNCVRELKRKRSREIPASNLLAPDEDATDLFDRLQPVAQALSSATPSFAELRPLVAAHHHETLEQFLEYGTKGRALAAHFGISEGAAHVRLSRALTELRAAYARWQEENAHE